MAPSQWWLLLYEPMSTIVVAFAHHSYWSHGHQLSNVGGPTLLIPKQLSDFSMEHVQLGQLVVQWLFRLRIVAYPLVQKPLGFAFPHSQSQNHPGNKGSIWTFDGIYHQECEIGLSKNRGYPNSWPFLMFRNGQIIMKQRMEWEIAFSCIFRQSHFSGGWPSTYTSCLSDLQQISRVLDDRTRLFQDCCHFALKSSSWRFAHPPLGPHQLGYNRYNPHNYMIIYDYMEVSNNMSLLLCSSILIRSLIHHRIFHYTSSNFGVAHLMETSIFASRGSSIPGSSLSWWP